MTGKKAILTREEYDQMFREIPEDRFASGKYRRINEVISANIQAIAPDVVLDLAAGHHDLAGLVRERVPSVRRYIWNDYASIPVSRARAAGAPWGAWFEVLEADLDGDLGVLPFQDADVVICTSMEHLANDVGILRAVPVGRRVVVSLPDFPANGHRRWFPSIQDAETRYAGLLSFERVTVIRENAYTKFVILGTRLP